MQLSGSPSQSVLQRNRSQDSHPIGGVRANPLSKQFLYCILTANTIINVEANVCTGNFE